MKLLCSTSRQQQQQPFPVSSGRAAGAPPNLLLPGSAPPNLLLPGSAPPACCVPRSSLVAQPTGLSPGVVQRSRSPDLVQLSHSCGSAHLYLPDAVQFSHTQKEQQAAGTPAAPPCSTAGLPRLWPSSKPTGAACSIHTPSSSSTAAVAVQQRRYHRRASRSAIGCSSSLFAGMLAWAATMLAEVKFCMSVCARWVLEQLVPRIVLVYLRSPAPAATPGCGRPSLHAECQAAAPAAAAPAASLLLVSPGQLVLVHACRACCGPQSVCRWSCSSCLFRHWFMRFCVGLSTCVLCVLGAVVVKQQVCAKPGLILGLVCSVTKRLTC